MLWNLIMNIKKRLLRDIKNKAFKPYFYSDFVVVDVA